MQIFLLDEQYTKVLCHKFPAAIKPEVQSKWLCKWTTFQNSSAHYLVNIQTRPFNTF